MVGVSRLPIKCCKIKDVKPVLSDSKAKGMQDHA